MIDTEARSEADKLASIARSYRRRGYSVSTPGAGDPVPAFLNGLAPDVIAERADDRVVVEVKSGNTLRGNNALREMTERVEREPGWRFELVAVAQLLPDQSIDTVQEAIVSTSEAGRPDVAFVVAVSAAEEALRDRATRLGIRGRDWSAQRLARDLVSRGELGREDYALLDVAWRWRNGFVHGVSGQRPPTRLDLDRLLKFGRVQSAA